MSAFDEMLKRLHASASFTKFMTPDKLAPSIEASILADPKKLHDARIVQGSFTWNRPEVHPLYKLRWVSPAAAADAGFTKKDIESEEFAKFVCGQSVYQDEDVYPYSQNYAGYQFGNWAGQLGDGRAHSLCEVTNPGTGKRYELQLKGSGHTPYSRFADGKAVLRSSIREMLVSETLNVLGIPTTRALAITELPASKARRERIEECAIVCRMAETFVRIGTFDLHHSRGNRSELRKLADYCIEHVFENKLGASSEDPEKNRYYHLFREVSVRNVEMIAKCQALGFLNGVLNTDNTSIYGLSLDYGPFAFMDTFDYAFSSNFEDHELRYNWRNTPTMMWWNCVRLGEALGEFMGAGSKVDEADFISKGFAFAENREQVVKHATDLIMDLGAEMEKLNTTVFISQIRKRLGLLQSFENDESEVVRPLLDLMNDCELDYNLFFRNLSQFSFFGSCEHDLDLLIPKERSSIAMKSVPEVKQDLETWLAIYGARLEKENNNDDAKRRERMNKVNPNFVLRNWILQDVIEDAQNGDWTTFDKVQKMALSPFQESWQEIDVYSKYLGAPPLDSRGMVCSCSS